MHAKRKAKLRKQLLRQAKTANAASRQAKSEKKGAAKRKIEAEKITRKAGTELNKKKRDANREACLFIYKDIRSNMG